MPKKTSLYESLKKTFIPEPKNKQNLSDYDTSLLIIDKSFNKDFTSEISPTIGFFDGGDRESYSNSSTNLILSSLSEQKRYIETFRDIVNHADVASAVSEIINEMVFTTGNEPLIKINFNDTKMTDSIKKMLSDGLSEIIKILKFDSNAYSIIHQWFVDGQLNVQTVYDNSDMNKGIIKINLLSPINLYFDKGTSEWVYALEEVNKFTGYISQSRTKISFKIDEVFKIDSGIYIDPSFKGSTLGTEKLILSELYTAIKPANQLKTVEDMLIPMRFSRSVSRRVFNVDVGDLNPQKAEAALEKIKQNFKYKKFYDIEKGTISNQNHVTTLVEDYWFPNRSGNRGTTVETLDETGNLGELGDVMYFKKKLYTALKIPMSRINNEIEGNTSEFDYGSTSIERDEVKFFAYIQRLRKRFLVLFEELLFRHLMAQGKITLEEWNEIFDSFYFYFSKENTFIQNLETDAINKKIESYNNISELIGKVFSVEYVFKNVLRMSDDDIQHLIEQREKEKKDPFYSSFYNTD